MKLYVALVHYPVLNRNGEVIASAVTNLDIHDIARACATYGVTGFFLITPLEDQKVLVHELASHWVEGQSPNIDRRNALSLVRIEDSIEDACERVAKETGVGRPVLVATSARPGPERLSWASLRKLLSGRTSRQGGARGAVMLLFGTASGLSDQVFQQCDHTLHPIEPDSPYNHLSVRSAVSITLDRLLGSFCGEDTK